jgi:hypothetical protein
MLISQVALSGILLVGFAFSRSFGEVTDPPTFHPTKKLITLKLTDADIFVVQNRLEREVPNVSFNLEFDQRDAAHITINAQDIPLDRVLNDICRTFHSTWTLDTENGAINIFPSETARYAYYPFDQVVPFYSFENQTRDQILFGLLGSPLLKDRYPLMYISNRPLSTEGEKQLTAAFSNRSLRYVLNWICANDGNRDSWSIVISTQGLASLSVGKRPAISGLDTTNRQKP